MAARRHFCSVPLAARCAALIALAMQAPDADAFFVSATTQWCFGTGAGECVTAPTVFGRPAIGQTLHTVECCQESAVMTVNYGSFAASASASGTHVPQGSPTFPGNFTRIGRGFGTFSDTVTAGTGGAPGYFRIPLRVVGGVAIDSTHGGSGAITFTCFASGIGSCTPVQFVFTESGSLDEIVNLDVPIVLGVPFDYSVTIGVGATTGYGAGDPVPWSGITDVDFGTRGRLPAVVLDAAKNPIPDAPISLGESGHDYQIAPEAAGLGSSLAACASLSSVATRRAARRRRRATCAAPQERDRRHGDRSVRVRGSRDPARLEREESRCGARW